MPNSFRMHLGGINTVKNYLVITMALGLVVSALAGCATLSPKPDFYPQIGDPYTIIYKDSSGKEVTVFDLSGKWEIYYYNAREVVDIIQKGNSFEGYKTIGNANAGKGQLTIFGNIEGNMIECNIQLYQTGQSNVPSQPIYSTGKLTKKIDSFECVAVGNTYHGGIFKRIE